MQSVLESIDRLKDSSPHRKAYSDGIDRSLTYGQLGQRLALMRTKVVEFGLAGKRIGLLACDSYSLGLAVLACSGTAVAAPLDRDLPSQVLKERADFLDLHALLYLGGTPDVASLGRPIHEFIPGRTESPWRHQGTGLLLTTSGSSGAAKKVHLDMSHVDSATKSIADVLELGPEDRCWGVLPLFHIHGLSSLFTTLYTGGTFLATGLPSREAVETSLKKLAPTWYTSSPALHFMLLESCGSSPEHSLKFVRSASGPAPLELIQRVERTLRVPFIEAYGMTEAGPQIASNGLAEEDRKAGSVGRPAGPEVSLVEGEIHIKGPNVAHQGWLATGDLGHFDQDGFLFVTGRKNELIDRGGLKIRPRDVERAAYAHPAVKSAAAFAISEEPWTQAVGLAVVLQGETSGLGEEDRAELETQIRSFMARRLPATHLPQSISFEESLPLTSSGKLKRRALRATTSLRDSRKRCGDWLATLWAEALGLEETSPDLHFFQQGGHSLSALSLLHKVECETGCRFGLSQLMQNPRLKEFSALVTAAQDSVALSQTQQEIWMACQTEEIAPLYSVSASLELKGSLDVEILQNALNLVLDSLPNVWVSC